MSLPILAQLFYILTYAGKLKSEIVTYIDTLFLLQLLMKTLPHRDT